MELQDKSNTGSNTTSKENGTKKDGMLTSSVIGPHGDSLPDPPAATRPPKRGFFRSFWKRSRHYSLEQQ
ncbi:hypothetical protein M8J77_008792 [Diaphorina citri]|nr:hypothetical protein M8J77_008792 [Diaphorina citri]